MTKGSVVFLSLVVSFAALARGGHDIWAATLVYLLVLAFGLFLLLKRAWGDKGVGIDHAASGPLALLLLVFSLSAFNSVNASESFLELLDWGTGILVFFISLQVFKKSDPLKTLLIFSVVVLIIHLGVSFYSLAQLPNPLWPPQRTAGTLVNANIAAAYTLFWIPPLTQQIKNEKNARWGLFWKVGLGVAILQIYLTYSAAAWVCLAILAPFTIGLPAFKKQFDQRPTQTKLFLGVIGVLVLFIIFSKGAEFVGGSNFFGMPTTSRGDWWRSGIHMFLDHPWLGIGLGNFPSAYLAYQVGSGQNTLFPHSFFIGFLSETGILGLSSVFFLMATAGIKIKRSWTRLGPRKPFALGLILFWIYSLVSLGPEYLVNIVISFLFLGILLAPVAKPWKPRKSVVLILGALGLGVLPYVGSPFLASQEVVTGYRQLKEGNRAQAMKSFSSATKLNPKSWEGFRGGARTQFLMYETNQNKTNLINAVTLQRRALDLNELHGYLAWELGTYLEEAGEDQQALQSYDMARHFHRRYPKFKQSYDRLQESLGEAP